MTEAFSSTDCASPRERRPSPPDTANIRGAAALFVVVLATMVLTGCVGEFSALRPGIDGLDKYNSAKAPKYDCADGDTQVRACALNTLQEFSELEKAGGSLDRDLGYILVGAGTAAAAMGSNVHPRAQAIKNIAVGAAGLVGIHAIANTDGQRTILIQAQNTVTCLMRVYDSIGPAKTQVASLQSVNLSNAPADFAHDAVARLRLSPEAATPVAAQQFAAVSQADVSTERLRNAITDAQANSVKTFAEGLLEVRIYVQNNLDKPSQDLTGLFKMQKDNITKLTGDVKSKASTNTVDAEVARHVAAITAVRSADLDQVSDNAKVTGQAADAIQNAVSSCNGS